MSAHETTPEPLMTRSEAALYLRVSPGTLAVWASTGRYGLKTIKVGKRAVRYSRSDLDRFLESWLPLQP